LYLCLINNFKRTTQITNFIEMELIINTMFKILRTSFIIIIFFFAKISFSQNVGINPTGTTPNTSAILDLNTGNAGTLGFLPPNVALTATNSNAPIGASVATSLLVYNTATASAGSTAVSPGYYYWDGAKWVALGGTGSKDWALLGNAGTTVGTNFLGTTDNVDLQFNVFNSRSGLIDIANYQTFFGYASGLSSTAAGQGGTFFGYGSGQSNIGGLFNTGMGYQSLVLNTAGGYNTALGVQSLYYTTGSNNTGLGTNAGFSISSGANNTALGYYAINNGSNTSTGSNNTAVGSNAMQSLTIGANNTSMGYFSTYSLTTGSYNAASGYSALKNNTTGSYNTGIGGDALFYIGSSYNTAVGMWSLEGNSTVATNTGIANTAIGFCAGGGYNGTPGSGTNNYLQTTSGSYNTFLGYSTAMTAGTYSNTTTVGSFAQAGANDVLILGGITGINGATNSAKVGIGTTTPADALVVKVPAASAINGITADVSAGNGSGNAINAASTGVVSVSTIFAEEKPTADGTGVPINTSNHAINGQMKTSHIYSYGMYGTFDSPANVLHAGGVVGYYNFNGNWGGLGYYSGFACYGGYFSGSSANIQGGAGRLANPTSTTYAQNVGIGAYGDLFGGWVRGNVYGLAVKGERVSLYVDGKTIVNQPIIQLTKTADDKTIVNYTPVSATPDLQLHGVAQMEKGVATITIDATALSQFASTEDLTIIATPTGQTNGVYAELRDGKLIIKENNNGFANTKVSWIIIGKRNITEDFVPAELKEKDFDTNLKGFMYDENDKDNSTQGNALYWDGTKLHKGTAPK